MNGKQKFVAGSLMLALSACSESPSGKEDVIDSIRQSFSPNITFIEKKPETRPEVTCFIIDKSDFPLKMECVSNIDECGKPISIVNSHDVLTTIRPLFRPSITFIEKQPVSRPDLTCLMADKMGQAPVMSCLPKICK